MIDRLVTAVVFMITACLFAVRGTLVLFVLAVIAGGIAYVVWSGD